MPAIINILGNLLFGGCLALVARNSATMRNELVSWTFFFLLAFESLFVTPIATYLFRFYPQWSMLYWFDPQIFTSFDQWVGWLSALAILLNFAAAFAGFILARWGVITHNIWFKALPMTVAIALIATVFWQFGNRIAFIGDYDAYWQGNASMFLARVPGWIGLFLHIGTILFVLWVHSRFGEREPRLF